MLAAILIATHSGTEPNPRLLLTRVWRREGVSKVSVEGRTLLVDGEPIDPDTGKPGKQLPYDVDFTFQSTAIDCQRTEGTRGFFTADLGSQASIELSGPVADSNRPTPFFWLKTISLVDSQGRFRGAAKLEAETFPAFHLPPYRVTGNWADGFLRLISEPFAYERNTEYNTVLTLGPFRLSPLKMVRYSDLSDPAYALGRYHPNFNLFLDSTSSDLRFVSGSALGCGNVFTGEIYWFNESLSWVGRVGAYVLAIHNDKGWLLLNKTNGKPIPVPLHSLKNCRTVFTHEGRLFATYQKPESESKTLVHFTFVEQ